MLTAASAPRAVQKTDQNMKISIDRNLSRQTAGFSLIELLVVIAIIAILAGTAMPALQQALLTGKQTQALGHARQIGMALRLYANDCDGQFPSQQSNPEESITTANDAFRLLVTNGYVETESIFAVPGSKAGGKADNKIDTPAQILARGENHWAYVAGLNSSSNSNWPLIVDHTDGSGFYSDQENDLGGTWKGRKGLVIRADSSAQMIQLKGVGRKRFLPRHNDVRLNALQVRDYMGDDAKLLEPAS